MDKVKEEKLDRASSLKDQVSRIYMSTIAANEREERLLNQKLDAIDMEHRAQFLRMKKDIRDARSFSSKRLQFLAVERHRSHEGKTCYTPPNFGIRNEKINHFEDQNYSEIEKISRQAVESVEALVSLKERPLGAKFFPTETGCDNELVGRLQYTENEVNRMRKSWVGQITPPRRKCTFLPHLEKKPDTKLSTAKGVAISNRRLVHRASCHPQLLANKQKEENLPEIGASSLPKSLERRLTLNGNTTSVLGGMKRESKAISKSLSSNF